MAKVPIPRPKKSAKGRSASARTWVGETSHQIHTLRRRLRLSPETFAAALGFTGDNARVTVWPWETGRRKPSAQTVALMKQLGSSER